MLVPQTTFNVLEDQSIGGTVARDLQLQTRAECEQTCLSDDDCGFYVYTQEQTRCFIYTSSASIQNVDGETAYEKAEVFTSGMCLYTVVTFDLLIAFCLVKIVNIGIILSITL